MSPSYHPRSSLLSTDAADMGVNARHARTRARTHARMHAVVHECVSFRGLRASRFCIIWHVVVHVIIQIDLKIRASRTDLSSSFSFSFSQSVSQSSESSSPPRVSPFWMSLFSWSFWSANSGFTHEWIKYYLISRYVDSTSTLINIE